MYIKLRCYRLCIIVLVALLGSCPFIASGENAMNPETSFDQVWENVDGIYVLQPLIQAMYQHWTGEDEDSAIQTIQHDEWLTGFETLYYMSQREYSDNEPIPLYFSLAPLNEGVSNQIINRKDLEEALEFVPIAYDALAFVVNANNPVSNISSSELAAVYTGEIVNWSQLDGNDIEITAFHRPWYSYSQKMLENLLMPGKPLAESPTQWIYADAGEGFTAFEVTSSYNNSESALGYTLFYYAQSMYGIENMKFLSVDGVTLDQNSITLNEYPWITTYYAVFPKGTPQDHPIRTLVAWLLTEEGQKLIKHAGFFPITGVNSETYILSEFDSQSEMHQSSGTGGTLDRNVEPLVYSEDCFDGIKPSYANGSHSYWNELLLDLPENDTIIEEIALWRISAEEELRLQFSGENIEEQTIQEYVFIYGNLVSFYLTLGTGYDTVIQTAVFDLAQSKQLQLSDLFLDGFNYIDYINQTLLQRSFREGGEELGMFCFEEQYLKQSFSGFPADYPHFFVSQEGSVCIAFPGMNPYVFVPSFQNAFLADVPIWHDISPWGGYKIEQSYTVTVNYDPNIFCYQLTVTIDDGQNPEIDHMVNELLAEAADRFLSIVKAQPLPQSQYYSSVTCMPVLDVYGNYYSFAVIAVPLSEYTTDCPTISGFIIDLHTGEPMLSDEQAKALVQNSSATFYYKDANATLWESMHAIDEYNISESTVVHSIWLSTNSDYEQTIEVEFMEVDNSVVRVSVPVSSTDI